MKPLDSFTIPVKGLGNGIHNFEFELDAPFFKAINEESTINANLISKVEFDKRDSMYILDIFVEGKFIADCDRCLNEIPVPVEGEYKLYIKRGLGEDEAEIVYIEQFEDQINIAKYVYDFAILSLPFKNVIEGCEEMEKPPCNFDMLEKWGQNSGEKDKEEEKKGSMWDQLSNLKFE